MRRETDYCPRRRNSMGRTAPFEGERKGSAAGDDFRDPIETVHSSPVENEEDQCNVQESFSRSLVEKKTNGVLAERLLVSSELQEMDPWAKSPEMQKTKMFTSSGRQGSAHKTCR